MRPKRLQRPFKASAGVALVMASDSDRLRVFALGVPARRQPDENARVIEWSQDHIRAPVGVEILELEIPCDGHFKHERRLRIEPALIVGAEQNAPLSCRAPDE